jgi:hypothetical protein
VLVIAEPGRRLAFEITFGPLKIARWEHVIVADPGGVPTCTVAEEWTDRRPGWYRAPADLALGSPDDDQPSWHGRDPGQSQPRCQERHKEPTTLRRLGTRWRCAPARRWTRTPKGGSIVALASGRGPISHLNQVRAHRRQQTPDPRRATARDRAAGRRRARARGG